MGLITNDANNDAYYSYHNINPNTCNINFNSQGKGSQIYTIYGPIATNISNGDPPIYCNFDLYDNNPEYYDPMFLETPNECTDKEYIETNIYTIDNLTNYIVLSNPQRNNVECSGNHDCKMYISLSLNSFDIISCKNAYFCSVIWYVLILRF